jgi:hypothetical protein
MYVIGLLTISAEADIIRPNIGGGYDIRRFGHGGYGYRILFAGFSGRRIRYLLHHADIRYLPYNYLLKYVEMK